VQRDSDAPSIRIVRYSHKGSEEPEELSPKGVTPTGMAAAPKKQGSRIRRTAVALIFDYEDLDRRVRRSSTSN
jgi:hypothetical protein